MDKQYEQISIDDYLRTIDNKPIKRVLIVNGTGGVGKNAFVEALSKYTSTYHTSIIDPIKDIAKDFWNGDKSEAGRKLLCEMKSVIENYCDYPWQCMAKVVNEFNHDLIPCQLLCIDMRACSQIQRAQKEFNAKAVLVVRDSVTPITSNTADADVYNMVYDYVVDNNGDQEHLLKEVEKLIEKLKGDIA